MTFQEKAQKHINKLILDKAAKGIMLSNSDMSMYLDNFVSKAERKEGKILVSSDDFDAFDLQIGNKLIEEKRVYINGNWESFNTLVRSKGFSAYCEVDIKKRIKEWKDKKHCVVMRDLEFPVDDQGSYVQPTDNAASNSYSHKFTPTN